MKANIIHRKNKYITQPNLLVLSDEAGLLVLGQNLTREQYLAICECIPEETAAIVPLTLERPEGEPRPTEYLVGEWRDRPKEKKKSLFSRFMRDLGRYALPVLVLALMLAGIVARLLIN